MPIQGMHILASRLTSEYYEHHTLATSFHVYKADKQDLYNKHKG